KGSFKFLDQKAFVKAVPATYTIQEGDTFWNIANNMDGIRVADLVAANPGVDMDALQIGQVIRLGDARGEAVKLVAKTKPAPEKQLAMKEFVLLPKTAESWKTYPLDVQAIAKNSDWSLTPARYGGLEYEVLARPQRDVV